MGIDICVVNYHTYDYLQNFLDSLELFTPSADYTLTIVDVESSDEILNVDLKGGSLIRRKDNCGYARACNLAATFGSNDIIGLFNADTSFINNTCIDYCIDFFNQNADVGVVGPMQVDSSGRVTHAGIFGTPSKPILADWYKSMRRVSRRNAKAVSVSGSAYFVRRSTWNELTCCPFYRAASPYALGALLPTPHFFEETFCSLHAAAHGYDVFFLGEALMRHEWHKSSKPGSQSHNFDISREIYREACKIHGMEHE